MSQLTVALAGNPNSGKTTCFNELTGSRQHVGNYAGVTVERKEGFCSFGPFSFTVVDLPGTYSLSAYSIEERVARDFILHDQPEAVLNIVDSSNLERNLYLTLQLLELERPLVLVLNMMDMAAKQGLRIRPHLLAEKLGVPVVLRSGQQSNRATDILKTLALQAEQKKASAFRVFYGEAEPYIQDLEAAALAGAQKLELPVRYFAVKLFEQDEVVLKKTASLPEGASLLKRAEDGRIALAEKGITEVTSYLVAKRYEQIQSLLQASVVKSSNIKITATDRIDNFLTHRLFGLPLFFGLMWLVFNLVFTIGAYPQDWLTTAFESLGELISHSMGEGPLRDLLVDGVLGGVGSVLSFVPTILLLFLGIAFLEDTGYMARAAFLMDRVMQQAGLHGKSFIPLLLGFGCNVPAIMGARTLESPRDRLVTILVIPFMSCSARLPVYTLLIGAFFDTVWAGTVLFSLYLLGIIIAIVMARIFRTAVFPGESEPFVMEMPPYRLPALRNLWLQMVERSLMYLRKAGTLILAVSIVMWFVTNYPAQETGDKTEAIAASYAGQLGRVLEPVMEPMGLDWRYGVSLFAGVAAKEVIVGSLGTVYSVESADDNPSSLMEALGRDDLLNPLKGYALMVFILLYAPCLPTLIMMKRETQSWFWPAFSACYSTGLAWALATLIYQGGHALGLG